MSSRVLLTRVKKKKKNLNPYFKGRHGFYIWKNSTTQSFSFDFVLCNEKTSTEINCDIYRSSACNVVRVRTPVKRRDFDCWFARKARQPYFKDWRYTVILHFSPFGLNLVNLKIHYFIRVYRLITIIYT